MDEFLLKEAEKIRTYVKDKYKGAYILKAQIDIKEKWIYYEVELRDNFIDRGNYSTRTEYGTKVFKD